MRRHILIDDILDDLDTGELIAAAESEEFAPLGFASFWDAAELSFIYRDAAEADLDARKQAEEHAFNPNANAKRLRAAYHANPEAHRASARERMRAMRARKGSQLEAA